MAEQAINTIYLLGEQPDVLCAAMIKNLTAVAFSGPGPSTAIAPSLPPDPPTPSQAGDDSASVPPTPAKTAMSRSSSANSLKQDTAGSFTLAQLVFVVGHVAIKHIVYLELVEREFKRRKDEKAKGEPYHECPRLMKRKSSSKGQ